MASNKSLLFTGFVLCLIGGLVALIAGILEIIGSLPSLSLGLAYGIVYCALGLLSVIFSLRVNRRYDSTAVILLLVFSIILIILGGLLTLIGVAGILMLIGAILLLVGKA